MSFFEAVLNIEKINESLVEFLGNVRLFDSKSCTWRDICSSLFIHRWMLSSHSSGLETEFLSQLFELFLIFTFASYPRKLS